MQPCWLQPEQRPPMEEVHLLLSYLCAGGRSPRRRRNREGALALTAPGGGSAGAGLGGGRPGSWGAQVSCSPLPPSFPLLEQFGR